jgi:hypothetical protein
MSKQTKVFSIMVLVLLMLSALPSAALAYSPPPAPPHQPARFAENDATSFVITSAVYQPKGPVFTFQVNGHVNKEDLRAAVFTTSSKTYKLNCVQTSESVVICSGPKSNAGMSGVIYVAGFGVWVQVPEATPTQKQQPG